MTRPNTSMQLCIMGVGARSSVGLRAMPGAAAIRAGISRVVEHPYMVDRAGEPYMVGMDRSIEHHDRHDRMTELALSALEELLEPLPPSPDRPLHVYLGLPEASRHYGAIHGQRLGQRIMAALAPRCRPHVVPVLEGNAAGMVALEKASAALDQGLCELAVVGGVDSFLDPDLLEELDAQHRVMSLANRWGFIPGEGAAMLLVCKSTVARTLRTPIKGTIRAVASSREPAAMHTDLVCTGQGLAYAMANAAREAGASITKQYCDIDGERYREHEMSYAISRVPPSTFVSANDYLAPASSWGHLGAASAPMLAILPLLHHERGASPGAWPMVWCGSESGRRGVLVLQLEGANG